MSKANEQLAMTSTVIAGLAFLLGAALVALIDVCMR